MAKCSVVLNRALDDVIHSNSDAGLPSQGRSASNLEPYKEIDKTTSNLIDTYKLHESIRDGYPDSIEQNVILELASIAKDTHKSTEYRQTVLNDLSSYIKHVANSNSDALLELYDEAARLSSPDMPLRVKELYSYTVNAIHDAIDISNIRPIKFTGSTESTDLKSGFVGDEIGTLNKTIAKYADTIKAGSMRDSLAEADVNAEKVLTSFGYTEPVLVHIRGPKLMISGGHGIHAEIDISRGILKATTTGFRKGDTQGQKFYMGIFELARQYGAKYVPEGLSNVNQIRAPINAYKFSRDSGYRIMSPQHHTRILNWGINLVNNELEKIKMPKLHELTEAQIQEAGNILGPVASIGSNTIRLYREFRARLSDGKFLSFMASMPFLAEAYNEGFNNGMQ